MDRPSLAPESPPPAPAGTVGGCRPQDQPTPQTELTLICSHRPHRRRTPQTLRTETPVCSPVCSHRAPRSTHPCQSRLARCPPLALQRIRRPAYLLQGQVRSVCRLRRPPGNLTRNDPDHCGDWGFLRHTLCFRPLSHNETASLCPGPPFLAGGTADPKETRRKTAPTTAATGVFVPYVIGYAPGGIGKRHLQPLR